MAVSKMLDLTKSEQVFDPDTFPYDVHIIGCGSTGSKVALELAKLGITKIFLHDFDTIVAHNVANQFFLPSQIGMLKVEALMKNIFAHTGTKVTCFPEKVEGSKTRLSGVVFVLTDTMTSRRDIWFNALRAKKDIGFVIETRMGVDEGRIYSLDPCLEAHAVVYDKLLPEEKDAETRTACTFTSTVGPTVDVLTGMAIWQMIKWHSGKVVENEIIFSLDPMMIISNHF